MSAILLRALSTPVLLLPTVRAGILISQWAACPATTGFSHSRRHSDCNSNLLLPRFLFFQARNAAIVREVLVSGEHGVDDSVRLSQALHQDNSLCVITWCIFWSVIAYIDPSSFQERCGYVNCFRASIEAIKLSKQACQLVPAWRIVDTFQRRPHCTR